MPVGMPHCPFSVTFYDCSPGRSLGAVTGLIAQRMFIHIRVVTLLLTFFVTLSPLIRGNNLCREITPLSVKRSYAINTTSDEMKDTIIDPHIGQTHLSASHTVTL
jgi:hypothetical protein